MPTPNPSTVRRALAVIVTGISLAVVAPATASASGGADNGCRGLYEVARFATFQQVGDTHGHETVHHLFEARGCGHHH